MRYRVVQVIYKNVFLWYNLIIYKYILLMITYN